MMPRSTSTEFSSLTALALLPVLLLLMAQVHSAHAGHDVKEAWTKFQTSCQKLKSLKAEEKTIIEQYKKALSDFEVLECSQAHDLGQRAYRSDKKAGKDVNFGDYLPGVCSKIASDINRLGQTFTAVSVLIKVQQVDCVQDAADYQTAANEVITDIMTAGTMSAPGTPVPPRRTATTGTSKKPPTNRRRRRPVKTTRKRHSESDTRAAAVITGVILWGVGQAIGGGKGGRRSGGGGGGGRGAPIP